VIPIAPPLPEINDTLQEATAVRLWLSASPGRAALVAAPPFDWPTARPVLLVTPSGTRIGPYRLLQEIRRGRFGVVWMAGPGGGAAIPARAIQASKDRGPGKNRARPVISGGETGSSM